MKKLIMSLVIISISFGILAQAPERMSHQVVIRNTGGAVVKNQIVGIQISILQGSSSGIPVYVETHTPTTNANGLASLEIGGGTVVTGTFSVINWAEGPYFLKTETDPAGGTSYTISGTSQILSVPYALYAKTSETSTDAVKITGNQTIAGNKTFSGTTTVIIPVNATDAANKAYVDILKEKIQNLENNLIATGTFKIEDIEGNQYNVVKIGTQAWMTENMKTTKYSDGTDIPLVIDNAAWQALVTPGYCWYNNDAATYKETYGALYNWYAVNTGKLCPTGWHVPTDAEWTTLENYLITNGYNFDGTTSGNKYAKALASTTLWTLSSITGAVGNTDYPAKRNATGFTTLPGGYRYFLGSFNYIALDGYWWSATEYGASEAWHRYMRYNDSSVTRSNHSLRRFGFSVRCLRD